MYAMYSDNSVTFAECRSEVRTVIPAEFENDACAYVRDSIDALFHLYFRVMKDGKPVTEWMPTVG